MVTFSCDLCSEILSKKNVGRHRLNCRKFSSVSCVDCNKTFEGDNFQAHKSCLSEVERYKISTSKKSLTKTNTELSKPLVQQAWMELIKKSLPVAPDLLKPFLYKLMNYDNVPRKEKDFVNFIHSNLMIRNANPDTVIESLWKYIYIMKKESFGILSNTFRNSLESDIEGEGKNVYMESRRYIPSYSSSENITSDSNEEIRKCCKQTTMEKKSNYDDISKNNVRNNEKEKMQNSSKKIIKKELISTSNLNEIKDSKYIFHDITVTKQQKVKSKTTITHCNDISQIIFMELLNLFSKTSDKKVKLKIIHRAINKKLKMTNQHCCKKEIINYIINSNKKIWILDKKRKTIFLV